MEYLLKHLLFAVFPFLMSVYFFSASLDLPNSAALLPRILAAIVAIMSIAMVYNAKKSPLSKNEDSAPKTDTEKINVTRVVVFIAAIAAYIYLIPVVGYFIVTPLFMVALYLYLQATSLLKAILISAGFTVFIYILFVWFLKLPISIGYAEQLLEML